MRILTLSRDPSVKLNDIPSKLISAVCGGVGGGVGPVLTEANEKRFGHGSSTFS